VEHGSLSPDIENLVTTYLALASGIEGTQIREADGAVLAQGENPHPLCNFVICWEREALDETLRRFAVRKGTHIYLEGDSLPKTEARLRPGHTLQLMSAQPGGVPESDLPIQYATDPDERREVALFMVEQFFRRSTRESQAIVAHSTASSPVLDLIAYRTGLLKRLAAAAMLVPTARTLGLYNLCLAPSLRGKGRGSSLVTAILAEASREGKVTVLQCEDRLMPWYMRCGFEHSGILKVWTMSP
jgi:GNAT superfamily N-acetyltransferase